MKNNYEIYSKIRNNDRNNFEYIYRKIWMSLERI